MPTLTRRLYARDAETVARALLGHRLVSAVGGRRCVGTIVETEAYVGPEDLASHAAGGRRTPRNEHMWHRPGTAYVYISHGIHRCFNVACLRAGHPAAVLIRALEPIEGLGTMRDRRPTARTDADLARGPGNLAKALGIGTEHSGLDLAEPASPVRLERARSRTLPDHAVTVTSRVGMGRSAGSWAAAPLRFRVAQTPCASRDPAS